MGKLRLGCALSLALIGCGDDGGSKTPDAPTVADAPADVAIDGPVETLGAHPALAMACNDALADVYTLPSGLPAMDDTRRGDVFRCAKAESLSKYKVNRQIDDYAMGYQNTVAGNATSGFWGYRIAYRSTRNTVAAARAEGAMGAILLVPETPLAGAPLLVFGHGSVGFAPQCAPSRVDLSGPKRDDDYPPVLLRLAGAGYTVIAPDYAGYSFNQPHGYFNAEDEAHAILDATRAAAKILTNPPAKVAFVGHSQGGHAAVAAQSYAESYGMTGQLVGVATLAPFWVSLTLFAAATTDAAGPLSTANAGDINSILYAMVYAWSATELREGAGSGTTVFQAAKRTAARDAMFGGACYDQAKMMALGTNPVDWFDATYVTQVANQCALGGNCTDATAAKWRARWPEDRPAIDATGAPILAMWGGADTFIGPARAACGRNKWAADTSGGGTTTMITNCYSATTAHRDFPRTSEVDYLMSWIANKAGIGPAPAACTAPPTTACAMFPNDF
ncbi:MAG: alpha/beta fold hydrolase [Myxococcales bacterium]|nr:alpha/beta fold hydrolase [Myxococcales bacterium]